MTKLWSDKIAVHGEENCGLKWHKLNFFLLSGHTLLEKAPDTFLSSAMETPVCCFWSYTIFMLHKDNLFVNNFTLFEYFFSELSGTCDGDNML